MLGGDLSFDAKKIFCEELFEALLFFSLMSLICRRSESSGLYRIGLVTPCNC